MRVYAIGNKPKDSTATCKSSNYRALASASRGSRGRAQSWFLAAGGAERRRRRRPGAVLAGGDACVPWKPRGSLPKTGPEAPPYEANTPSFLAEMDVFSLISSRKADPNSRISTNVKISTPKSTKSLRSGEPSKLYCRKPFLLMKTASK